MNESEYRQRQIVTRLFGHGARLDGSIGTTERPGRLTVVVDDHQLGSGVTFADALAETSARLRQDERTAANMTTESNSETTR